MERNNRMNDDQEYQIYLKMINENIKNWLSKSPEDALKSINEFFKNKSKYSINIGEF